MMLNKDSFINWMAVVDENEGAPCVILGGDLDVTCLAALADANAFIAACISPPLTPSKSIFKSAILIRFFPSHMALRMAASVNAISAAVEPPSASANQPHSQTLSQLYVRRLQHLILITWLLLPSLRNLSPLLRYVRFPPASFASGHFYVGGSDNIYRSTEYYKPLTSYAMLLGLPRGLATTITEGDLLAMFELYGIVVHIESGRRSRYWDRSRCFSSLK